MSGGNGGEAEFKTSFNSYGSGEVTQVFYPPKEQSLMEIAAQLKRIADKLEKDLK
jgi:hypothetical protein